MTTAVPSLLLPIPGGRKIVVNEMRRDIPAVVYQELEQLSKVSLDPVYLVISCSGGWEEYWQSLCFVLSQSSVLIFGVIAEGTLTAGFINILQYCSRRFVSRGSQFVFHPPGKNPERLTPSVTHEIPRSVGVQSFFPRPSVLLGKKLGYLVFLARLAERSGQSFEDLERWGKEGKVYSAEEAKRLGFVDEIIDGIFETAP